jgi:hypothetical protein
VVAAGIFIVFPQPACASRPVPRVPEPAFEFAPALDGAVIEHAFNLHKAGATLLAIERIESG